MIDGKSFFDFPQKYQEKTYKKIIQMSRNNDYTTGNLLDFAFFKQNCKLIVIDSSKQTKSKEPQQNDFIGRLEEQNQGAKIFFNIEKSEEITVKFLQIFLNIL